MISYVRRTFFFIERVSQSFSRSANEKEEPSNEREIFIGLRYLSEVLLTRRNYGNGVRVDRDYQPHDDFYATPLRAAKRTD